MDFHPRKRRQTVEHQILSNQELYLANNLVFCQQFKTYPKGPGVSLILEEQPAVKITRVLSQLIYQNPNDILMRRVVITGVGAVTSLGHNVSATWKALVSGASGTRRIQAGDPVIQNKRPYDLALIRDFQFSKWRVPHANSRMNSFLHAACEEALNQSSIKFTEDDVVGLNIGTMSSNISKMTQYISVASLSSPQTINRLSMLHILANIPGSTLAVKYKFRGPMSTTSVACATGLASIGDAYNWIAMGDADYAIAGGTEDVYNPTCVYSSIKLQTMATRQDLQPEEMSRPFDEQRCGFILGEGAGVVVLETYDSAKRRGAKILGQIVGYGCFSDGHHLTQPDSKGSGAFRAMKIALNKANVKSSQVDHINCHATSTLVGDQAEARAIQNLFGNHRPTITALKSYFGHSFGSAGAIELIMGLKSLQQGLAIKILNLSSPINYDLQFLRQNRKQDMKYLLKNAFGFGGVNCSMLIKKIAQ